MSGNIDRSMAFSAAIVTARAINRGRKTDDIVDGNVAALTGDAIVLSNGIRARRGLNVSQRHESSEHSLSHCA